LLLSRPVDWPISFKAATNCEKPVISQQRS
jgi:hypothetical protein